MCRLFRDAQIWKSRSQNPRSGLSLFASFDPNARLVRRFSSQPQTLEIFQKFRLQRGAIRFPRNRKELIGCDSAVARIFYHRADAVT